MVLKAISLTKHKGAENWYYRRAGPADVQRTLRDQPQGSRPQVGIEPTSASRFEPLIARPRERGALW